MHEYLIHVCSAYELCLYWRLIDTVLHYNLIFYAEHSPISRQDCWNINNKIDQTNQVSHDIASCSTNSVTCFMSNQCVGVQFLRASDSFGVGSGPIFLDRLNCMSGDTSVLNCVPRSIQGLPECNHDRDVGVHCEGMSLTA